MVNSIEILERAACYCTNTTGEELHSRSRKRNVVFARYLIAVTAVSKFGISQAAAGRLVGLKRCTVTHAKKVLGELDSFGTGEEMLWWRMFNVMVGEF